MVKTPDSMPSLGEMSNDSTEVANVSRVLFQTPEREGTEVSIGGGRYHVHGDTDYHSIFDSDSSIASESFDARADQQHDDPGAHRPYLRHILESLPAECIELLHGSYVGEGRLSPKELAAIYNIFDASQKHETRSQRSVDSGNDAVTEITSNIDQSTVTWERKIDSLERENVTLKEIIAADSATILRLKTELSRMEDEQRPPDKNLATLEQETLRQQEETIKLLRQEIETLTKAAKVPNATSKELEQLRLENELLAAQIVENEAEVVETRRSIKQLAVENVELKLELSKQKSGTNNAETPVAGISPQSDRSLDYLLITQVASLTARISDIERALHTRHALQMRAHTLSVHEHRDDSLDNSTSPCQQGGALDTRSNVLIETCDTNEVEVTIDSSLGTSSKSQNQSDGPKQAVQMRKMNEPRFRFCDCFRPNMSMVEV
jgi:predicted nuclease with TOPRIM domain